MTQRLYYDDSYKTEFTAQVVEELIVDNRPALVLNKSCFYPTSGGQPFDTGNINGSPVIDVFTRDQDAAVIHVLEHPIQDIKDVSGIVDWTRRFDHMQHHTGQHILTQAFVQRVGAKTVGFHLSLDTVTIDLDSNEITEQQVAHVEDIANQIVFENRPVKVHLHNSDQQDGVRVRRLPRHLLTEGLRVIEIENFDSTACGGTHVAYTGEIGLIKILKVEKRGNKIRVEFCCGRRALRDYREKNRVAHQLASSLNTRFPEVPDIVSKMREDNKAMLADLKLSSDQLVDYEAKELLSSVPRRADGIAVVVAAFEGRDPVSLRLLASRLVVRPDVIALLGIAGQKSHLCFACSEDLSLNMSRILKEALAEFGGSGGGQPNLAQGGGRPAELGVVQQVLDAVAQGIKL